MSNMKLTKENIIEEFLTLVPELKERYEKEMEWWSGEFPGFHNLFGNVLNPYLEEIHDKYLKVEKEDYKDILCRIYSFIEYMAISSDDDIKNVVQVTILEKIGDNKVILENAYKFMGKEAKKLSDEIEKYWGRK